MLHAVISAHVYRRPASVVICQHLGVELLALEFNPRASEYRGTYTAPHLSEPRHFIECTAYADAPGVIAARAHLDHGQPLAPEILRAAEYIPTPDLPPNIRLIQLTDPSGVLSSYLIDTRAGH